MANCFTRRSKYPRCVTRKDFINFFPKKELKGYLEMADESYNTTEAPVTFEYREPQGKKRKNDRDLQKHERVPGVIYDERSIYRQDYTDIKPPYSEDLTWRPNQCRISDREVRGVLPGFHGAQYTNPYSRLDGETQATYESSGTERMKQDIAAEVERQRAHDRAIPVPRITLPEKATEKFTEYRSGFCTTAKGDESLPDVKPMAEGLYKYYEGEDSFSYNSQHRNKAY